MTGNEARQTYLDYFAKHEHQIVRSSSLVPQDDPTLLFTNAGMVQFKRVFLGEEKRNYVRATTSQKCVRAGGKHNDLENVGYTARHHTFFEMLGNFSFGDYFKEKAIDFAWDLLTNGYGLPADKLWVSIYLDDDEAHDLWHRNIGVPVERIVRFDEKDNFWAMGDTGPCGPCSEVHLDRGEAHGCGRPDCMLGCECDRFLEIWNLVFMQFNRDTSGTLTPLPKPSIDTGLGLERIVSVKQNTVTNFETDLMLPIIRAAENLSERPFGALREDDVAMKVIADHSRAAAFLIGDGVLPSNEGRGYVLRRIMRRAIRYGRNIGLTKPFLHKTAAVVFDIMRPAYPELTESAAYITNVIENEEVRFNETLDKGLRLLNDSLANVRAKGERRVPGELIFKLYDTYGFPVDIVQDVVRDEQMALDMEGFEQRMSQQRQRSRKIKAFAPASEAYKRLTSEGVMPEFTGYGTLSQYAQVMALVVEGQEVEAASEGAVVEVVTDETPFYGEAGGQLGDTGTITAPGLQLTVTDTLKDPTGLIIHHGRIDAGKIEKNNRVTLSVDAEKRAATACNHTATHLLHAALRHVLGDHVKQAGSLVSPERLRFDFTHFTQVDRKSIARIENFVNNRIRQNVPVEVEEMEAEAAFQSGATALFEEKYGDRVRVINLADFSKELCGGTHTGYTGDIGLFKIFSESSVAAGVRRIEALTGTAAVAYVQSCEQQLRQAAEQLRVVPEAVPERVEKLLGEVRAYEKQVQQLKTDLATKVTTQAGVEAKEINGVKVMGQVVSVDSPAALRDLADRLSDQLGSGVVVLGAQSNGKALLIVKVSKDLTDRLHAGNLVKVAAAEVGGGGGGRPDMAQAGGSNPEKLDRAIAKALSMIGEE
jgi:alanyl-tRNA synthetase